MYTHPAMQAIVSKDHAIAHMLALLFLPADNLLPHLFVRQPGDAWSSWHEQGKRAAAGSAH